MTDAGEPAPLDRAELSKAWQAVQKKYAKEFAPSPQRLTAWHLQGAAECERQHLWVGALQHLNPLIAAGATADLHGRRGHANQELRRWQAAKSDYAQALAGNSERWDWWAGRAEAEAALGEWKTALADYSKAIERKGIGRSCGRGEAASRPKTATGARPPLTWKKPCTWASRMQPSGVSTFWRSWPAETRQIIGAGASAW